MREATAPNLDLKALANVYDPFPVYAWLRDHDPVHWSGSRIWLRRGTAGLGYRAQGGGASASDNAYISGEGWRIAERRVPGRSVDPVTFRTPAERSRRATRRNVSTA